MAGKKEEKVEVPEENPEPEQETTTEPQADTFTQEQLDAARKEAAEQAKQEAWKEYQGIQRTVSKKDAEIKRLQTELGKSPTSTQPSILSKLVDAMEDEGGNTPRIQQLRAELAQEEAKAQWKASVDAARSGMEEEIRVAGLDPEDPMFDSVHAAFDFGSITGDYTRAHALLDKKLKTAQPKEEVKEVKETSKQETPEEMEARIREKVRLEMLKENDNLKQDTGLPSSGGLHGLTPEGLRAKLSEPGGLEWFREHEKEIDQMHREGKLQRKE